MEKLGQKGILTTVAILGSFWLLAGAAHAAELGTMDLSKEKVTEIQQFIEDEKKSGDVDEIAVYATDKDGNTTRIASTDKSAVGKPADPEDIDAIINDQVVSIPEGKKLDVTVALHNDKGLPAAVAGIKLGTTDKRDKNASQKMAEEIAKKIGAVMLK